MHARDLCDAPGLLIRIASRRHRLVRRGACSNRGDWPNARIRHGEREQLRTPRRGDIGGEISIAICRVVMRPEEAGIFRDLRPGEDEKTKVRRIPRCWHEPRANSGGPWLYSLNRRPLRGPRQSSRSRPSPVSALPGYDPLAVGEQGEVLPPYSSLVSA